MIIPLPKVQPELTIDEETHLDRAVWNVIFHVIKIVNEFAPVGFGNARTPGRVPDRNKESTMKYRFISLAFVLSTPPFLLNSTIVGSRDTAAQGGCFPGTYLVVEGSGTQSLWTLSHDGALQVTSSAERAFGFSHIQGVWKKTGARDAKARGLDFNFSETPVNSGVPPSNIARLDIVMSFADKCEEMEGSFELRVFNPSDDPLDSNGSVAASDTFSGRRFSID